MIDTAELSKAITEAIEHDRLVSSVSRALESETMRLRRIGKRGEWCIGCGSDSDALQKCTCAFPALFGCAGPLVCQRCHASHTIVSGQIRAMLRAPRVQRADSLRYQIKNQILAAVKNCRSAGAEELAFRFDLADPFRDQDVLFVRMIINAFKKSGFWNFQELADQLRARDTKLARAIRRALVPTR